jgi:large subunit ribosomal protein L19
MTTHVPTIEKLTASQKRDLPPCRVGDTVRVHYRIREGEKERVQVFEGVVMRATGGGIGSTFTVRKRSGGVGVERIFPTHSPRIEKLEVVSHGRVRRARLYFLRDREGKAARLRERVDVERQRGAKAAAKAEAKAKAKPAAKPAAEAAPEQA